MQMKKALWPVVSDRPSICLSTCLFSFVKPRILQFYFYQYFVLAFYFFLPTKSFTFAGSFTEMHDAHKINRCSLSFICLFDFRTSLVSYFLKNFLQQILKTRNCRSSKIEEMTSKMKKELGISKFSHSQGTVILHSRNTRSGQVQCRLPHARLLSLYALHILICRKVRKIQNCIRGSSAGGGASRSNNSCSPAVFQTFRKRSREAGRGNSA